MESMDFKCRILEKELYSFESLYKFIQRACTVLNCRNVAKHTQFYLG
jgi:hypothetical protein